MVIIEDNDISLTRGDTCYFSLSLVRDEESGEEYEIKTTDTVVFSVRETDDDVSNPTYLVQKVVQGSGDIKLTPEDTKGLSYGTFKYDVQLTTADGDVYTVIGPKKFKMLKEVTL